VLKAAVLIHVKSLDMRQGWLTNYFIRQTRWIAVYHASRSSFTNKTTSQVAEPDAEGHRANPHGESNRTDMRNMRNMRQVEL
jgi:hypothetical protein